LRILFAHCRYQQRGGEDVVLENEMALLAERGHEVDLFQVSNDSIQSFVDKCRAAASVTYRSDARRMLAERLEDYRPDLVHVHNFFPLLSPSVYDACADAGVPAVQTLHNFRIVCANAGLVRNNAACDLCVDGSAYLWATRYRCYRGSLLGSAALAHMIATHRRRGTWNRKVGRLICLSRFALGMFTRSGIPEAQLRVVPNFSFDRFGAGAPARADPPSALYVGRLTESKGVKVLVEAWDAMPFRLDLVGDGDLASWIAARASPNIRLRGYLTGEALLDAYREASLLMAPSLVSEGSPLSVIEAMSAALPLAVSSVPPLGEYVEDGVNGRVWKDLTAAGLHSLALDLLSQPEALRQMGRNSRQIFEERYTPDAHCRNLLAIYEDLVAADHPAG
jgi:glycosyltransferase involved in cell wall biosynthesis